MIVWKIYKHLEDIEGLINDNWVYWVNRLGPNRSLECLVWSETNPCKTDLVAKFKEKRCSEKK